MNQFRDKYCPVCLMPLSASGDCWTPCEFESDNSIGLKALTKQERTQRLLDDAKLNELKLKAALKETRKAIREYTEALSGVL